MSKMKFYALWLSAVCIFMYLLQIIIPGFTEFFVLDQQSWLEPWRFVTSIFLHGSVSHLILNLFALMLFGMILESVVGSKKFILVFIIAGVGANLISVNFYNSALGASGAIFGVIGAVAVLRPFMAILAYSVPMPMFIAAILYALADLIGIFNPSGVGNIAHLSGLAVGLIFGALFWKNHREIRKRKAKLWIDENEIRELERRMKRD